MKTKLFTLFIVFFIAFNTFAQTNLNQYKYVIVPKKFDFLKSENRYRLNELSQFLFGKYNFTAIMEGSDYPEDLLSNRCLALRSDVVKESGMFTTRLQVVLKDCNDKVVYTSEMGESREKEYKVAYNKALREAFNSFESLNYKYTPNENLLSSIQKENKEEVKTQTQEEIKKLKEEIESLKKETAKAEEKVVEVKDMSQVMLNQKKDVASSNAASKKASSGVLYAQPIDNGFQLVDSSPKVIYKIKNTGLKNVYLVEDTSAIVYKNGDNWVLENHTQNAIILEELNIKF